MLSTSMPDMSRVCLSWQGQQAVTIHRKVHMAFDKSGVNKIPLQIMDLCLRATERKDLIVGAKRSDPSPGNNKPALREENHP